MTTSHLGVSKNISAVLLCYSSLSLYVISMDRYFYFMHIKKSGEIHDRKYFFICIIIVSAIPDLY